MDLRTAYWDDPDAHAAFRRFLRETLGLDLTRWGEAGYWDPDYRPFSFFEGGEVISSVCLYLVDAYVHGRRVRLAQISGVATRPERRGQGLNRRLTEEALAWAEGRHEGVFLFSRDESRGFYQRQGFQPVDDFVWAAPPPATTPRPGHRLDLTDRDALAWIYARAAAATREPPSREFAGMQARLLLFHLLYDRSLEAVRDPEGELVVVVRRGEGGTLQVLDLIGEAIPPLASWYPWVATGAERDLEVHFPVGRLELEGATLRPCEGNFAHVLPGFPVERPVFPATLFA